MSKRAQSFVGCCGVVCLLVLVVVVLFLCCVLRDLLVPLTVRTGVYGTVRIKPQILCCSTDHLIPSNVVQREISLLDLSCLT